MAESGQAGGEAKAGKRGGRKLLLIAAAAVLVLGGGGGAAAYFLGLLPGSAAAEGGDGAGQSDHGEGHGTDHGDGHADDHGSDGGTAKDGKGPGVVFVDVPEMLVNLQPDGKRMRFLRLRLALETGGQKSADGLAALMPRVLDSFQMYLRALTVDEVQGSAGMQKLKEEMIARVNLAIEPERVRDVLVKEMLVQ